VIPKLPDCLGSVMNPLDNSIEVVRIFFSKQTVTLPLSLSACTPVGSFLFFGRPRCDVGWKRAQFGAIGRESTVDCCRKRIS
jgi:hypothetical protein